MLKAVTKITMNFKYFIDINAFSESIECHHHINHLWTGTGRSYQISF